MTSWKKKLALALALCATLTFSSVMASDPPPEADPTTSLKNDAPTADRIKQLEDIAMHYYWNGGDLKKAEEEIFKGITLKGKYDVVENAYIRAATIDPHSTDLKFSLASTQIIQKKIPEALETYEQILQLDPKHYEANLLHGMYASINGDQKTYKRAIANAMKLDSHRTNDYLNKFKTVEATMKEKLNTSPPKNLPKKNHAIVILGYALAEDGTMQETLIERLKVGLQTAQQNPNSKIIVTGGVPKQGVTEAESMRDWLVENGIDEKRIMLEDASTDTVENALFTTAILEQEGLKDVTLITSASHMRRALTTFKEATSLYDEMNDQKSKRKFTNVVYLDYPTVEEAHKITKDERLVVYRDLFRTSGIWQYPGKQR